MKNKILQRAICLLLSAILLFGAVGITSSAAGLKHDPTEENPYVVPSLDEMEKLVGVTSYTDYLLSHAGLKQGSEAPPVIDIWADLTPGSNAELVLNSQTCINAKGENEGNWADFDWDVNAGNSVYLPATGSATWSFNFNEEQAGFYFIKIRYFNCITDESSVSAIERLFKIDGYAPFNEVKTVTFNKTWSFDNVVVETFDAAGQPDSYDIDYKVIEEGVDKGYYKIVTSVKDGIKTVSTYLITMDVNGNSMAPGAVAKPTWSDFYLQDATGYHNGYFSFCFEDGGHSITLEAERDPLIIQSIELVPAVSDEDIPFYREVLKDYMEKGYTAANGAVIEIQGEFPDYISDSSVAPSNDNTSAITQPISAGSQLYNVIGETSFSTVGQWAAYKFQVTDSGLYNFGMRYKQSALEGMFVCRAIKLSGGHYGSAPTAPFKEAFNAEFDYNKKWQSNFVSAEVEYLKDGRVYTEESPLLFYFEEGVEYTLYLECSLGTLKNYVQRVETSLSKLNAAYLRILQYTGTSPDKNKTYNFYGVMPEVLITLLEESQELLSVKRGLEELCGSSGSHLATLETVAMLLDTMGENDGDKIPENMTSFKSYLGTLGTWINDSKSGSLTIDSIWVTPAKDKIPAESFTNISDPREYAHSFGSDSDVLPKAKAGFFKSLWFEVKSFFYSFWVKYDQMGLREVPAEGAPQIDVWLASGRDQSQVWRTMIDAKGSYTDNTGNAVALKLVTGGTLLPSILSGKGPDVYLGLGSADVINYAIRDAIVGINGKGNKENTGLTDSERAIFSSTYYTYRDENGNVFTYKDENGRTVSASTTTLTPEEMMVKGWTGTYTVDSVPFDQFVEGSFASAAMDTVTLLDISYGVPLTMSFAMMFYRMDVLAEIGYDVPETWSELLSLLPALQSKNLSMGVAYISALDFMIYQKGGSMWKYTDSTKYDSKYAGAKVDLDSNEALESFEYVCRLYSDYSLPVSYDAANRFRTGEMPIIIGDYAGIYNQLVVFATEIGGLWSFCSLPGTEIKDEEGNVTGINYDSLAGVTATVILRGCDSLLASWQFVQWQTGEEAQAEYGNRMVAIIGPSAKYETANLKAIDDLSWTAGEKAAIMNQMDHMSSIVNYPGSYIITRYMQFAFLDAVNDDADPYDAMTGYINAINTEIKRKREEFGLWVPTEEMPEPIEKGEEPDTTE